MQEENNISSHFFSQRTERLAAVMGVNIQDLPDIIGVSRRMLFGYRSGSHQVSAKALAKLVAAEERAGIGKEMTYPIETMQNPLQVVERSTGYGGGKKEKFLEQRVADLESHVVDIDSRHNEIMSILSEIRNSQKKNFPESEEK